MSQSANGLATALKAVLPSVAWTPRTNGTQQPDPVKIDDAIALQVDNHGGWEQAILWFNATGGGEAQPVYYRITVERLS